MSENPLELDLRSAILKSGAHAFSKLSALVSDAKAPYRSIGEKVTIYRPDGISDQEWQALRACLQDIAEGRA